MPAIRKVNKDDIIKSCIKIIETEGIENLNVRRIAKELGCSTQPIYYIYSNIDELKSDVLKEVATIFYNDIFEKNYEKPVYKDIGKNYIRFAKEKSVLFKLLFNNEINETVSGFMYLTGPLEKIKKTISNQTGLSEENAQKFHIRMWLYANGIANLVANNICHFSDDEIESLIGEQYFSQLLLEIKKGYIKEDVLNYAMNNKLKEKRKL